jgi:glutaredoxin 2
MAMTIFALKKNHMEQFIVSARKSPQTFNDVVGQKQLPILC